MPGRICLTTFLSLAGPLVTAVFPEEELFQHIDLQPHANQRLDEDFLPGHYPGDMLAEMSQGVQRFGGVTFRIEPSLIQVAGKFLPDHPIRVEGIEIGQHVEKLHLLHAARWGAYGKRGDGLGHWVADGTPIGYYEVVYEDGSAEAIPIVYGVDVRDWWSIWDDSKPTKQSKVVWTGSNPHLRTRREAQHTETPLRLYLSTWENPHPTLLVANLSFVSLNQTATPFCVAVTSEKSRGDYAEQIRELGSEVERIERKLRELRKAVP